jgi:signal transduction histidine kinase
MPAARCGLALHREPDAVRIDVIDDGAGMSQAQLDRLFEPFDRLGRETGPVAGTGIGLVITRQLVLLMNGRMHIESEPGRGTQVHLCCPAADDVHGAAPPRPATRARPPRHRSTCRGRGALHRGRP